MSHKTTLEEFLRKTYEIHGNKYDYSLIKKNALCKENDVNLAYYSLRYYRSKVNQPIYNKENMFFDTKTLLDYLHSIDETADKENSGEQDGKTEENH